MGDSLPSTVVSTQQFETDKILSVILSEEVIVTDDVLVDGKESGKVT